MSKEAKPIAVVYVHDIVFEINDRHRFQGQLAESWSDYHVIVIPVPPEIQQRVFELEVFYDKNFTETNYEDLKKWIENCILKPQTPPIHKP